MVYLILGTVALSFFGLMLWKIHKAHQEIDRLFKQNEQLQTEKAAAQTQVKHYKVKQKNEENSRNTDRATLLDRLQQQGDLRD